MEKRQDTTHKILINQGNSNFNNIGQPFHLSIGMILDNKYEIKREIARGGMGIIYEAYHRYVHRKVAIKIMLGNKIDALHLKRFQKEMDACSRLLNPNVVKLYDASTYNNNPYIVMEYIDGVDICQYIAQHDEAYGKQQAENAEKKERDWKLCAKLIYETALGLEYIHQQKLFHRDIKPSNIMVRSNGSPVIIDLGVVKFNQELSYNLTRSRDIIGTCQYMSIEQAQGKRGQVDARSDVYSLGLVLYELLTEQQAYTGKNMTDVFNKIVSYSPPTPREINPQIPEMLEAITIHATEKQKEKRYATAQEFADALKQYLDDENAQAVAQYAYYKKRLWLKRKIIIACCVVLLLAGIAIISMLSKQETFVKDHASKVSKNQGNAQNDAEIQFKLGMMYEEGRGVKQDYKKAREFYERAANLGHTEAQNKLGDLYCYGRGVKQDVKKAIELYEKSAKQGFVEAQYNLAIMYHHGYGVQNDDKKAEYWYEKAARQGHTKAQNNLGTVYCQQNEYQKAVYWYVKVASQGIASAQVDLGYLYENGKGVKQDYNKAVYWYKKAVELYKKDANQGNTDAQVNLGWMYENGKGVKQDLQKAFYWYEKASNQGYPNAQFFLSRLYENGKGVKQDYAKAVYWCEQAANQGFSEAQEKLKNLYNNTQKFSQNSSDKIIALEKAANQGDTEAQLILGNLYAEGKGVAKDYKKAHDLWEKAANQGHPNAQFNLGVMYAEGKGVPKDYKKAHDLWEKAANQGYVNAQYNLGDMYYAGKGVEKDLEKAKYWLEKATNQGHEQAQQLLKKIESQEGKK